MPPQTVGRDEEALEEGRKLLAASRDRLKPLLVPAQVYQRQYRRHRAAQLHEQALRRPRSGTNWRLPRRRWWKSMVSTGRKRVVAVNKCPLVRSLTAHRPTPDRPGREPMSHGSS
jgi:hypothetical protein